jgi:type IV pilus assembly protein PilM
MCLFGKQALGIDIADCSIEAVLVKSFFNQRKIVGLGRTALSPDIVRRGRIISGERLAEAVRKVLSEAKPDKIKCKSVVFSLPESQTFLHHCDLILPDKKDIEAQIKKELLGNVPVEENDLEYSYSILKVEKEKYTILAAATRKTVLQEWADFFKKMRFRVKGVDIEILATFRDLFDFLPKEPVAVVDIGSTTSFVGIFDKDGLRYEYIINIAGEAFTRAIAKASGLDLEKSEAIKVQSGLENNDLKIKEAILEQVNKIITELTETLSSFKEKTGQEVAKLILVGGSGRLVGLDKYFADNLHLPVQVGSARSLSAKTPLEYVEAIGLALRGVEKFWNKRDPIFK